MLDCSRWCLKELNISGLCVCDSLGLKNCDRTTKLDVCWIVDSNSLAGIKVEDAEEEESQQVNKSWDWTPNGGGKFKDRKKAKTWLVARVSGRWVDLIFLIFFPSHSRRYLQLLSKDKTSFVQMKISDPWAAGSKIILSKLSFSISVVILRTWGWVWWSNGQQIARHSIGYPWMLNTWLYLT